MDAQAFLDPFVRLLEAECAPATVRAIEAGKSADALWQAILASGYLDALVPEADGGVGLCLADVAPILMALGASAMPLPVAETIVARGLLAALGAAIPDAPIVLLAQGCSWPVPGGVLADWALTQQDRQLSLHRVVEVKAPGVFGDLSAHLTLDKGQVLGDVPVGRLMALAAVIRAAAIAGAADKLLSMTTSYANDRIQFGRPIGKQQAVQQQLAVMAQYSVAARLAAQMGCASGLDVSIQAAATAKYVANLAAADIAAISHAVHGAIGISAEFDLNLLTKRLHAWRLADGGEAFWSEKLGQLRLDGDRNIVDFIRR